MNKNTQNLNADNNSKIRDELIHEYVSDYGSFVLMSNSNDPAWIYASVFYDMGDRKNKACFAVSA